MDLFLRHAHTPFGVKCKPYCLENHHEFSKHLLMRRVTIRVNRLYISSDVSFGHAGSLSNPCVGTVSSREAGIHALGSWLKFA